MPNPQPVTEREETQQQRVDSAASGYVGPACELFKRLSISTESFFREIYDDREWESFDWLDYQPSRQFSTLVSSIWRQVQKLDPSISLPSQTEVNNWFQLFLRQQELSDLGVPEQKIPANRGASNALAALSKDVPTAQRYEVEAELLQKLELAPDQAVTAKAIKGLEPPKLKPESVRDTVGKPLAAINTDAWEQITGGVARLRLVLNSRGDIFDRVSAARAIVRGLAENCLVDNASALVALDDDGGFAGWIWQRLDANPARKADRDFWLGSSWLVSAAEPAGAVGLTADLPQPDSDDVVAHLLATATGWEATDELCSKVGAHVDFILLGCPLSTWQWWRDQGGCPIGTSWVDVNKRKLTTPPAG